MTLFKTLVLPKLEHNISVWFSSYRTDFKKLEGVQRCATKLIPGLSHLSYSDRLKALDLPTISYRCLHGDLIQVYKYLNNYYDVGWSNNLFHLITELYYSTRGHKLKLCKHAPNPKLRENFFTVRVINNWNAFPDYVVYSTSLNAFENA